jgi:hypothetical protein
MSSKDEAHLTIKMSGLCEIGTTVENEKFLEPKYEIAINVCIFSNTP